MTRISYLFLFIALIASAASAQNTNWYYDQSTRYGTFRHYQNGGTKLISGIDYAGELAESYRAAARAKEERERQRLIEMERMGMERLKERNNRSYTPAGTPQKNYGPTPADLARQKQEEKDGFYRQYEELLNNAKG
ncbi:MAG: hypothetical protein LPK45_07315, partial [Bacteroidota bacterium]|nr:hypothetical protein [Bacteroidota bacterium]MDX5469630.1 hypothetical protein [Bacteroidota bacterium]